MNVTREPMKYLLRWRDAQGACVRSAVWDARRPFALAGGAFVLERARDGELRRRPLENSRGQSIERFAGGAAAWTTVFSGNGFQVEAKAFEKTALFDPSALRIDLTPEVDAFPNLLKKVGGAGMLLLAALAMTSWIRTRNDPKLDTKIIPPQFAKILAKPRPQEGPKGRVAPAGGAAGEGAGGQKTAAKTEKASQTAVVKAFRSKSITNAVQGLLKGGMSSLLVAESQLLAGDAQHDARKIFDGAGARGAFATNPNAGLGEGRAVAVAALGGGPGGGGTGSGVGAGVGYGAGRAAGIKGQGESFVALDLPGAAVDEGLSKEEVGKVIHAHISEVRYCYEASMIRAPELEGKLVLDFTIGSNGAVKTASVKESTLADPRLDDCILRRLTKWAFPKPSGGVDVAVAYPFIFKALKR